MGRKKTKGAFYKNGKRKQPSTKAERENASRTLPTPETMAHIDSRLAYWVAPMWSQAATEQCYDNAGILWITGWFNGHGFQPEEIRDIFRDYARLYWQWYSMTAPKCAKHERVGHSEPDTRKTKDERDFMRLDERLPIGSVERKAVHDMAVDDWHFDEYDAKALALANLGRLRLKRDLRIAGEIAPDAGKEMDWLNAAIRGACSMLDGKLPSRRQWDRPLWALNDDGEEKAA